VVWQPPATFHVYVYMPFLKKYNPGLVRRRLSMQDALTPPFPLHSAVFLLVSRVLPPALLYRGSTHPSGFQALSSSPKNTGNIARPVLLRSPVHPIATFMATMTLVSGHLWPLFPSACYGPGACPRPKRQCTAAPCPGGRGYARPPERWLKVPVSRNCKSLHLATDIKVSPAHFPRKTLLHRPPSCS
jgi:hypothetical protein